MSSLHTQFKTNPDLERKGVLLEYGTTSETKGADGVVIPGKPICIRIARAGGSNKQFEKRLEILTKPIRRQLQNETVDTAQLETIMRQVYAETVVLGWENVEDAGGKPLPFTRENCIQLFTDLPDLFTDIQEQARKSALFRQANLEADAGN